jgi:TonB-linked SusC/RagA family outer membrane protein
MKKKLAFIRFYLKLQLRMKLTILSFFLFVLQISATISTKGQSIDLQVKDQTIKEVLRIIEKKTGYRFFFNDAYADLNKMVTIDVNNTSINQLMKKLLRDSKISYKILENNLIVIAPSTELQKSQITGIVIDAETGEPLIGINVKVEGTNTGAITDFEGRYSLEITTDNAVLIFSFTGYQTQKIQVQGQTSIDVKLVPDIKSLEEVVVVGYGTMKRKDLTGSVVSVSDDAISKTVTTSLDQALSGRAAGVQVMQNSGTPGGGSSIRIRGISSLNLSNEPIIVIDGVTIDGSTGSGNQNALSSINPSDIVSIDVLKDASATAIYGSRAANGVIIVTTKRGNKGQTTITYDGYTGWQEMPKKLDLLNLREYAIHKNTRTEEGIVMPDNNFIRTDLLGEGTDWQDELFTKAMMTNHNISVSGGNENTTYALSVGYLDQDGMAIGSGFKRLNVRGNVDTKVNKFIKVGMNFAFSNSKQKTTVNDASLINIALKQTPDVAVRNAEGSFDGPSTSEYVQSNPIGLAMLNDNHNEYAGIRANTFLEATILKGLTFKTEFSLDYNFGNSYTFNPSYDFGAIHMEIREGTRFKNFSKFWSVKNIFNFNREFGVHSINVMLGQEAQQSIWENLNGYRSGYLTNGATDLAAGNPLTARNDGINGKSTISSYFGRVFYSLNDKYLLTTTLRHDGSSKFYKDYRWGWFPSAAFAWRISNENFMKNSLVINNLKLRLGWGLVGNQNVESREYAYTSTYTTVATPNWGAGILARNTPNKELKWEKTSSSNIGIDLNLFKNRIELILDVYYKKTNNLLLLASLPGYVGVSGQGSSTAPMVNIGSLENKGIEITLNTVNMSKSDFVWRSGIVFSLNRNKVLALYSETGIYDKTIQEGSDVNIITRTAVGQPIGQFYGYKITGRFENATDFYYRNSDGEIVPTALPEGLTISEDGMWIGDYIFKDVKEDGTINEQDRTYIGNPEPAFTFGLNNSFSYKGFELGIYLSGVYGNEVVNYQRRWLENARGNTNLLDKATHYAKLELINPDGPVDYRNIHIVGGDPDMPRITNSPIASESNFRFSDKFVEDGSFLRIQNISLGYSFPKEWISRFHIQSLKLYTNLQNLYTFTKYSGYDPEIGSMNQDVLMTGIDNGRYPMPRMYTFGINITL